MTMRDRITLDANVFSGDPKGSALTHVMEIQPYSAPLRVASKRVCEKGVPLVACLPVRGWEDYENTGGQAARGTQR